MQTIKAVKDKLFGKKSDGNTFGDSIKNTLAAIEKYTVPKSIDQATKDAIAELKAKDLASAANKKMKALGHDYQDTPTTEQRDAMVRDGVKAGMSNAEIKIATGVNLDDPINAGVRDKILNIANGTSAKSLLSKLKEGTRNVSDDDLPDTPSKKEYTDAAEAYRKHNAFANGYLAPQ